MKKQKKIAAVILGAGLGARMGGYPKPLIKYKNKFFIEYIYENLIKLDIETIVLVAGFKHSILIEKLKHLDKIHFVVNQNFEAGQFSSLKCGLEYLQNNFSVENVLIALSDTPFVKQETYEILINSIEPNKTIIPSYNYQCGHPVIIDDFISKQILDADNNTTAKQIIKKFEKRIKYINVDDKNIIKDFDYKNEFFGDDWTFENFDVSQ